MSGLGAWIGWVLLGVIFTSIGSFAAGYRLCHRNIRQLARHCLHRRDVFRLFGDPWPPLDRCPCEYCDAYWSERGCTAYGDFFGPHPEDDTERMKRDE